MASERTVLVVEGDPPEAIEAAVVAGAAPAGYHFGAVLRVLDPSLEIEVVVPSLPEFDPRAFEFEGVIGVALTGSAAPWSADARQAAPHRAFLHRVFDHDLPVFGSCWGLHVATAVLGGALRESPGGVEFGVARNVTLTEAGRRHPMYSDKPYAFDAISMHRDEVDRPPEGAQILAGNSHSNVQAMVYERGMIKFWGVQYHPELGPESVAQALKREDAPAFVDGELFLDEADRALIAGDYQLMGEEPEREAALRWRYGVTDDVAFFERRTVELSNWVAMLGPGR
ncbi:MAG: type 1 glutamine amidotransferase [Rhodobacteraceae bacterium]|nr:type 1 glutamine amidotransferase [Paracoccaceae bacterium]